MEKPCYYYPQKKGKDPESCFEGTPDKEDCTVLKKGGCWEECRWGGKYSNA